jgi:hypothetical protein
VRLGFFPSSPLFFEFFSSSFCHRISGKERIEIGKGLGRFKNKFQTFLKTESLSQNNLQNVLQTL